MSDPRRAGLTNPALQRAATVPSAAVERWNLPPVEGPVLGRPPRDDRKTAAAAEAIALIARQEAETRGYEAGLAKAQAEWQTRIAELEDRIQRLDSILKLLGRPLQSLEVEIEHDLVSLALAVGKQLARRELRVDPTQVISIVRESLAQLPAAARDVRVHLHPEDATTIRERLAAPGNERAWTLIEDPTLSRGGCIVRTENSQIDARLESRVNLVIASALGDERGGERRPPGTTDTAAEGGAKGQSPRTAP